MRHIPAGRRVLAAGLACVLVGGAGYLLANRGGNDPTVVAQFANAQFLVPGNTVHVNGVTAGSVEKMQVEHNTALVTLQINSHFWPIHADATAEIRPVTLLGELYVDLNPGSASAPAMPNGGTIPLSHTTSSTNLQSVLNSLDNPTSAALALLVGTAGEGLAGNGRNAAAAIRALAPALTQTDGLVNLLDSQNQLLASMIDDVKPVVAAIDTGQGGRLDHLVAATDTMLQATAHSQAALGSDIQQLPGALDAARSAFDQLEGLASQATPALDSLTPLTANLPAVSEELSGLAAAANPAITSLQPVVSRVGNLVGAAAPVVSTLQAAGPAGLADANAAVPLAEKNVANLNNLFGFIAGWALTTQDYDNISHWFRFGEVVSRRGEVSPYVNVGNTGNLGGSASAKPIVPVPALPPIPGVPALPSAPASPSNTSATGLTAGQEQSLLGYLLGGS